MVVAAKFAAFLENVAERLGHYQQSLLRHEKNPGDREFLNDISKAVHAIKNAALPVGLGRISELCFHLENYLQRIRQERQAISPEMIALLTAGRDRLAKLAADIEISGGERATIRDLLKRIQDETAPPSAPPAPPDPPRPAPEKKTAPEPAPALKPLTPALEDQEPEPSPAWDEGESLLPEEIKNQDYDQELFQIFIEQMQENLSLLRTLANGYPGAASKAKTIALCSELVGKLQTSANYMGYEQLADYYLQWVAELEMAGVELTMGNPVSFAFMDERIGTIAALFPQITDVPASAAAVRKAEGELSEAAPAPGRAAKPVSPAPAEKELFGDLFHGMDEAEEHDEDTGPVAALSGFDDEAAGIPPSPHPATEPGARKKRIVAPPVELTATFLEEERQSPEFDEELFQIFVQQLQENLSQLRTLVGSFAAAAHKGTIVSQCSALLGKLQSSANYMGYEPLAEYYLQWIAELEMVGVDLSLGSPVSMAFMEDKIGKIIELFPQVREATGPAVPFPPREEQPPPKPKAVPPEPSEAESFKELFIGLDEEEEDEDFDPESVPIAALSQFDEEEESELASLAEEADLPEVHAFFGEEEPAPAAAPKTAPASDTSPAPALADIFGEEEAIPAEVEPIAALSGTGPAQASLEATALAEETLPELDAFFGDLGIEKEPAPPKGKMVPAPSGLTKEPVAGPAAGEILAGIEDFFADSGEGEEDNEFPASFAEPLAALSDAEAVEPPTPGTEVTEAPGQLTDLFGDEEEEFPASFAEPLAALSGEETVTAPASGHEEMEVPGEIAGLFGEEEWETAAYLPAAEDIEALFTTAAGGDDHDFEAEDEALAALSDSVAADLHPVTESASSKTKPALPADELAGLFGEEEEAAPTVAEPVAAPVPPEREALFRKLSHALKSLDEETPAAGTSLEEPVAALASPPPTGEDPQLFARLFGALTETAGDEDHGAVKPIDQVVEEILAPEEIIPSAPALHPEPEPVAIAMPEPGAGLGLDPERLNHLTDQIGELAAGRSSLAHLTEEIGLFSRHLEEQELLDRDGIAPLRTLLHRLTETATTLGRLSGELRADILRVRMVPANRLLERYPELIRDLARQAGKEIELVLQGEDAEIDQFMLEDLGDCVRHLLSNAVTHGLEPAAERQVMGKPPVGKLTIRVRQKGEQTVIEVMDDGRGIDPKKIKTVALAQGLASGDELFKMADQDLTRLLLAPGFTTTPSAPAAERQGLNRVAAIMARLGGRVQITSTVGQGTRVSLQVPHRQPFCQVLKVRIASTLLALPLSSIEEIVRGSTATLIQDGEGELIPFRGENIPLLPLARLVGMDVPELHRDRFPVVVINGETGPVGLIVDETIGLEMIPARAHGELGAGGITGAEGITFIADVAGLVATAGAAVEG